MNENISVCQMIEQACEAKGLSKRELSRLAKISDTELARIELGEREIPNPKTLRKISKHIGINYNDLMYAAGDGIDVNGSTYITGGDIKVDCPINSGNSALDYDSIFEVTGGTLIAGGASGMLQGCSSSSSIYNLTITFNSSYSGDDVITIVDSFNNEIISYQSSKSYSSLVVASPKLQKGSTYTVKVNGEEYKSFTISSIITTIGNNNNMGGVPGGPGGKRR